MHLHEYQAKELLAGWDLPIPRFAVAGTLKELQKAIEELQLQEGVVKVQVHAGGRGKAGGVQVGKSPEELLSLGKKLLGLRITNRQTGPEGVVARNILLSELVDIEKEFYLAVLVDRKRGTPVLIASPEGGMEIEEIAQKNPEKILTLPLSLDGRLRLFQQVALAKFMGWTQGSIRQGCLIASRLARCLTETDALLIEINPLVQTPSGDLLLLDAKCTVDDNALFRQKRIAAYFDPTQLPPREAEAKEQGLAYVSMPGQIGCMVNGAGLAMATMDIIQLYGGTPANFLDVGGGASKEKIAAGFRILLSDPNVRAVLIHIFGGIMNCSTLAEGVIEAASSCKVQVPIIVRMEGTHVERGRKLLKESGLTIQTAEDLSEAAQKAVQAARGGA